MYMFVCVCVCVLYFSVYRGWSGGAMVLANLQYRGVLLIWIRVGIWPAALAVDAGWDCLDIFLSSACHFCFSFSLYLRGGPI